MSYDVTRAGMTESSESKVSSKIAPDFAEVENSGVSFDWTWSNVVALNQDIRLLVKTKQMPKEKGALSKPLVVWYLLTVIGFVMSVPIILTLMRQYYLDEGSNLFAGAVLGATGVSVIFFAQKIYYFLKKPFGKPRFNVKNIRAGIDNDTLWIRDENLLSVLLSKSCIKKVVQIEDVIVASIGDTASYPFPRKILGTTLKGKAIIEWFEKHWSESLASNTYRFNSVRKPWYRRLIRKTFMTLSVFGFIILIIAGLIYVSDAWQATKRDEAISKLNPPNSPNDASKSLSGPAAGDFLNHLTHPEMR